MNDELIDEIKKRILEHHKLYRLTIKGEYWEDIFSQAVLQIGGFSDWAPERTHTIGMDQICSWGDYNNLRISNKSGLYTISSQTLKISGSRSTSYDTLEEKIQHFSNKQEDFYSCLATSSLKKDPNYYLFFFGGILAPYTTNIYVYFSKPPMQFLQFLQIFQIFQMHQWCSLQGKYNTK